MTNYAEMLHVLDRVHGDVHLLQSTLEATAHIVAFCRDRKIDFSLRPDAVSIGYMRDQGQIGAPGSIDVEKVLSTLQGFQTDLYRNVFNDQQRVEFDAFAAEKFKSEGERLRLENL